MRCNKFVCVCMVHTGCLCHPAKVISHTLLWLCTCGFCNTLFLLHIYIKFFAMHPPFNCSFEIRALNDIWGVSRKLATFGKMTVTGVYLRYLNVLLLYYPFMSNPRPCLGCATHPTNVVYSPSFFSCRWFCVPYITTFCLFCVNQQERPNFDPSV